MKRYVIVGASHRCYNMFAVGLQPYIGKELEITGIYDINRTRCEVFKKRLGDALTIYSDFDVMLRTEKPDAVIVATTDATHAEYVIRTLDAGIDVVCEKPLTNSFENCLAIREAEKRSGKTVTVTFNCRFMPHFAAIKSVIAEGRIGKVHAVSYEYSLNRWHGGDYFKRWHRRMESSAGMLVHKSTHHFDIVNWLLDDIPESVVAFGKRSFYGNPERAFADRCSRCERSSECESYKSQSAPLDEEMYFKAEHEDGYIRDRCAHLPDSNIYDNMSVSVAYSKGALLTYSLNLFSMREGYRITVTGERGVIVASHFATGYGADDGYETVLLTAEDKAEHIPLDIAEGAHGGGDKRLNAMIFGGETCDPLGQCADSFAGVASAMIGIGANESILTGKVYDLRGALEQLR